MDSKPPPSTAVLSVSLPSFCSLAVVTSSAEAVALSSSKFAVFSLLSASPVVESASKDAWVIFRPKRKSQRTNR
jgi:hypothetical protein